MIDYAGSPLFRLSNLPVTLILPPVIFLHHTRCWDRYDLSGTPAIKCQNRVSFSQVGPSHLAESPPASPSTPNLEGFSWVWTYIFRAACQKWLWMLTYREINNQQGGYCILTTIPNRAIYFLGYINNHHICQQINTDWCWAAGLFKDGQHPPRSLPMALHPSAHPPGQRDRGVRVRRLHWYQSPFITPSSALWSFSQTAQESHSPVWQWGGGWWEQNSVFGQSSPDMKT